MDVPSVQGSQEEPTISHLRQNLGAIICRRYPFLSGAGSIANSGLFRKLMPDVRVDVWCPLHGGQLLAPLDDYVGRAAFYMGDLDPKLTAIASRVLRPGDVALDIGANLGVMTVLFSRLVGPAGRVLAFEPNPRVLERTRQTTAKLSNVRLCEFALGPCPDTLELVVPAKNLGLGSLVVDNQRFGADAKRVTVPVERLDDVLAREGVNEVRLVKMDVEGFEPQVLRGAERCLREIRPQVILFEMNQPTPVSEHETFKLLGAAGYTFLAIPRSLLWLRLERVDLTRGGPPLGHDFVAIAPGEAGAQVAAGLPIS
ncbi:MAG: FkbM family methyltransferase [Pirellula sp.]|nr:FkbM family methyltransferase [Pirellula sp.]